MAPSRRMGAAPCFETPHFVRLLSMRPRKHRPWGSCIPRGHGAQSAPLPTLQTKQLRRLAQRRQLRRMDGLGRARLGRVVRRVLLAAERLARELNEVMGDEPHAEKGVDLRAERRVDTRRTEWPGG